MSIGSMSVRTIEIQPGPFSMIRRMTVHMPQCESRVTCSACHFLLELCYDLVFISSE